MTLRTTTLTATATLVAAVAFSAMPVAAWAKSKSTGSTECAGLPGQAALMAGLRLAHQASAIPGNGNGINWIAVVNRRGEMCSVASNDRDTAAAGVAPNFEHGLPLFNAKGVFMGAIAVAGSGSGCANHLLAWRARAAYYLDYVPSNYASSKAGPISWPGNLAPTACSNSPAGLTAQNDLPPTRRNPALADQNQALREQ